MPIILAKFYLMDLACIVFTYGYGSEFRAIDAKAVSSDLHHS